MKIVFFKSILCAVFFTFTISSSLYAASEHPDGERRPGLKAVFALIKNDAKALRDRVRAIRVSHKRSAVADVPLHGPTDLLLQAVCNRDIDAARAALNEHANIDAHYSMSGDRAIDGDTALIQAVRGRHNEMVQFLIASKASVEKVGRDGITALSAAIKCFCEDDRDENILKMLIFAGARYDPKADFSFIDSLKISEMYDSSPDVWSRSFNEEMWDQNRKICLIRERTSGAAQIIAKTQEVQQAVKAYDTVSEALKVFLPGFFADIVIKYVLSECYDPETRAEMLRAHWEHIGYGIIG